MNMFGSHKTEVRAKRMIRIKAMSLLDVYEDEFNRMRGIMDEEVEAILKPIRQDWDKQNRREFDKAYEEVKRLEAEVE